MAVVLNGTSQGVDLPATADITAGGAPIFMYAEFRTSGTNEKTILGLGLLDGVRLVEMSFLGTEPFISVSHSGGTANVFAGSQADVNDSNLHRIFVAYDGTNRYVYIDGTERFTTAAATGTINTNAGLGSIGYKKNWTTDIRWFNGQISNVAVWTGGSTGLNTTAAAALTNGTDTVSEYTTGLAAHWPLDYDARDLGPHGLHGTAIGGASFTESPPVLPVANAGADQTTEVSTLVTLDGSASANSDTYAWTQLSGPSVSLSGASTNTATFTPSTPGVRVFQLTASDGGLDPDTDTCTVWTYSNLATVYATAANPGSWALVGGAIDAILDDASDTTYIESPQSPAASEIELNATPLESGQPTTVKYRYGASAATPIASLTVRLMCGATQVAQWTHTNVTNSVVNGSQALTSGQLATINGIAGGWNDLRLEFTAGLA